MPRQSKAVSQHGSVITSYQKNSYGKASIDEFLSQQAMTYSSILNSQQGSRDLVESFKGKNFKEAINGVKSLQNLQKSNTQLTLPPAPSTLSIRKSQTPPLTVLGYRSDLFNSNNRYSNNPKREDLNVKHSKDHMSNLTASMNSLKLSPSKAAAVRWKMKQSAYKTTQYPDPLLNASPGFMKRITEMAALEVDTIRYEKSRKFKKR